jgi:RNA polymerase sigma factor (sigma-70 family)
MTRPGARTDAELVQDFLTGNSAALGDLYDRFAPGLYDTAAAMLRDRDGASDVVQDVFCVAATKLGQLRDPTRVKPWLYAIARHEIFRRTKQRSRSTSLDALGDEFGMDPMASPDPLAEGAVAESQELASLVRDAAYGLDPTDQLLLELSARQGLVGAELAAAIGVPVAKAHSMVFRMRERLERAVGAVVVTRGGRRRCEDLAAVLVGWDGRFDVLWRKRISRHIEDCTTCQETRKGAAVLSMAGLAPAFALPGMLREQTLSKALGAGFGGPGGPGTEASAGRYGFDADGFPVSGRRRSAAGRGGGDGLAARSLPIAVAGTMVAALVIVLGMVTLTPPTIDGSVSDEAVSPVALTAESTLPETTEMTTTSTSSTTSSSTTTTSSTSTTVPPPAPPTPPPTVPPTAVIAAPPTVGTTPRPTTTAPTTTTLAPTTTSTTTSSTTTTIATTPSPPQIRSFSVNPSTLSSCGDLSPDAAALAYDRDGNLASAVVTWSGRSGSGSNQLSGAGGQYGGQIGPFPQLAGGTYTVTLTVTDTTGLNATSSTSVGVGPC